MISDRIKRGINVATCDRPPTGCPVHDVHILLTHSHQNDDVLTVLLHVGNSIARGEIPKSVVSVVLRIPVLALVEVQGVTGGIVLVVGHALTVTVAVVEAPNEGLPPGTRHDLGPLTELLEGSDATRPPTVSGEGGLRARQGGGGANALPP